jgi:hypothetical protein
MYIHIKQHVHPIHPSVYSVSNTKFTTAEVVAVVNIMFLKCLTGLIVMELVIYNITKLKLNSMV